MTDYSDFRYGDALSALDQDALRRLWVLLQDENAGERDRLSLRGILDQLCADGLLEIVSSRTGAPGERYRLTPLGLARLRGPDQEE